MPLTIEKSTLLTYFLDQKSIQKKELSDYCISLEEALFNEQKSTAGDKHDTSRAMVHLEQEKLQQQLKSIDRTIQVIQELLKVDSSGQTAQYGALLQTDDNYILMGIGLGKQIYDSHTVLCISMESPLARQLLGKTIGDQFQLGNQNLRIVAIR